MKRILFCTLLAVFLSPSFAEGANPFTSTGPAPSGASIAEGHSPLGGMLTALAPLLRVLTERLARLTNDLHEARRPGPLLALLLASFVYGMFHALGPGHGKTMVTAFFLAKEAKIRQSLVVGYLIAIVHAVSALSVVMVLFFLIQRIFSTQFESTSRIIRILSFGIIAALGAVMLARKILGKRHHEHAHFHPSEGGGAVTTKELFGIALASGIVPCPGASAVILLSLSLNMIAVSVISVSMISLGMGLTVSAIGALAILAKRGVLRLAGASEHGGEGPHGHDVPSQERGSLIRRIVEMIGATVLFLFGILFLLAQF